MKKTIFFLFFFVLAFYVASAQEDPVKLAKQAGRALTSYNMDPSNVSKLDEAKTKINQALQAESVQAWPPPGKRKARYIVLSSSAK